MQFLAEENAELLAWTGTRDAPNAILDEQPPKSHGADIVTLAERSAQARALFPVKSAERVIAWVISAEICGEGGFAWSGRLMSMAKWRADLPQTRIMRAAYDAPAAVVANAPGRVVDILGLLAETLHGQAWRGSRYCVGDRSFACDIHWACFSQTLAPLPEGALSDANVVAKGLYEPTQDHSGRA